MLSPSTLMAVRNLDYDTKYGTLCIIHDILAFLNWNHIHHSRGRYVYNYFSLTKRENFTEKNWQPKTAKMFSKMRKVELPVEEPVDGEDDGNILRGQTHRLQHHHHRYQTSLAQALVLLIISYFIHLYISFSFFFLSFYPFPCESLIGFDWISGAV